MKKKKKNMMDVRTTMRSKETDSVYVILLRVRDTDRDRSVVTRSEHPPLPWRFHHPLPEVELSV